VETQGVLRTTHTCSVCRRFRCICRRSCVRAGSKPAGAPPAQIRGLALKLCEIRAVCKQTCVLLPHCSKAVRRRSLPARRRLAPIPCPSPPPPSALGPPSVPQAGTPVGGPPSPWGRGNRVCLPRGMGGPLMAKRNYCGRCNTHHGRTMLVCLLASPAPRQCILPGTHTKACDSRTCFLAPFLSTRDAALSQGWRFGGDGRCTRIPQAISGKAEAAACASRRSCAAGYPVREAGGLIWVWPTAGDDEAAGVGLCLGWYMPSWRSKTDPVRTAFNPPPHAGLTRPCMALDDLVATLAGCASIRIASHRCVRALSGPQLPRSCRCRGSSRSTWPPGASCSGTEGCCPTGDHFCCFM
jgi:hypothetical protein